MPTIPALTIHNKSTQPCQVYVEPLARDYTLLHNDEGEIFQLDPDLGPAPDEPLTIAIHEYGLTIFAFYDYEFLVNDEPAECGFQRPPDYHPSLKLERWLPATPKQVYELWNDATLLSKAFGSPVTHSHDPARYSHTYRAYNNTLEWSDFLAKPGNKLYLFWRTSDFSGTQSDTHVNITLEEQDGGTRLLIWLSGLPISPPQNWQEYWRDYWEQFILAPLHRYFAENEDL
jgi:Activator of Hsp90 ATPase homolog 1-like protein